MTGPTVLRPRAVWLVGFVMLGLLVLGTALWAHATGTEDVRRLRIAVIFGAVWTFGALLALHPRASFLRVDAEGIEYRFAFLGRRYRWDEIGAFRVHRHRRTETVVIEHRDGSWRKRGGIPSLYPLSSAELVDLLEACRRRWGVRGGHADRARDRAWR